MASFGAAYAAYAAPNEGTTILYWYSSPKTVLNPPVNSKIQNLSMPLSVFSSTFQGKCNFQGLFKTVLYIQVLFKPVRTLSYTSGQSQDWCTLPQTGKDPESFIRGSLTLTMFLVDDGERIQIILKAGHYWPASKMPFKWRFAGWPMLVKHCILAW